jgi:hypothetical protein
VIPVPLQIQLLAGLHSDVHSIGENRSGQALHPSDVAAIVAPMPEKHLPRGGPCPLGPHIREIVPGGVLQDLIVMSTREFTSSLRTRMASQYTIWSSPCDTVIVDEDTSMPFLERIRHARQQSNLQSHRSRPQADGGVSNKEAGRDWEAHQRAESI